MGLPVDQGYVRGGAHAPERADRSGRCSSTSSSTARGRSTIISDKTKAIHKQRTPADDILRSFSGAEDLAVATYNCADGVAVRFSATMRAGGDALSRAFAATQRAARTLQQANEGCGLVAGTALSGHWGCAAGSWPSLGRSAGEGCLTTTWRTSTS